MVRIWRRNISHFSFKFHNTNLIFAFHFIIAAAYLLVSLVPSQSFRTNYRAASLKLPIHTPHRDLSDEAQLVLHTILNLLLRLLRPARVYTDILVHGPNKLSAYFGLMTYCMVSKTEKLMVNDITIITKPLSHQKY